jgi:AcrR family transcriptional regulator
MALPRNARAAAKSTPTPLRKAGRPRDETITEAILSAARDIYVDRGWFGFNFDAIAKVSGAGKNAIYSRWRDREDLLFEVVAQSYKQDFTSEGTSLFEDLLALGRHVLDAHEDYYRSTVLWSRLRADLVTNVRVFQRINDELIQGRLESYRNVVRRAISRGEIERNEATALLLELFVGGLMQHFLYPGAGNPRNVAEERDQLIERFARAVLAAVGWEKRKSDQGAARTEKRRSATAAARLHPVASRKKRVR